MNYKNLNGLHLTNAMEYTMFGTSEFLFATQQKEPLLSLLLLVSFVSHSDM